MSGVLAACAAVVIASLLVRASFRRGRRHRGCRLPAGVLRELAYHKRDCLGEAPERVALELELLFGATGDTDAVAQVRPRDGGRSGGRADERFGSPALALARRVRIFRRRI